MSEAKISEAAVEAAFQAYISHDDTVETSIRSALVAALPHLHQQPAELADLYRHLLDMLGAKSHEDAGRIIGELHGKSLNCTCPSGDGSLRWPCPKHPPAELAEQQGVDGWDIAMKVRADLDRQSCPDAYMCIAVESVMKHLAATGKQQVGEVLIQRPAAPHAANNAPSPTIRMQIGEVQVDSRIPVEMADALERIAGGALADYEGVEADEMHILRCAKLIRDLATGGAAR